jgi:hypothetical protein
MTYPVNPNDPSTPTNDQGATQGAEELRALKTKIASLVAGLFLTGATNTNAYALTNLLHPSAGTQGRGVVASGWDFAGRNQQWGGAPAWFEQVDAATGTLYKFEAFDGYVDDDGSTRAMGSAAGTVYEYQVITAPKNLSIQAYWGKLYKILNPVDNVFVQLWSVAAGVPGALIATSAVISGKQITSKTDGAMYRFAFASAQALVAGTQYIIAFTRSGAVDAANYYGLKIRNATATKYPNNLCGAGTAAFAWTPANTTTLIFMAEAQASDQVLQSGGLFDWQLVGFDPTTYLNRMGALNNRLVDMKWNVKKGTIVIRGNSFGKGKTFFDALYGLHHDRLVAYTNAVTGIPSVSILQKDGTVSTISGTSDISGTTPRDIFIEYRSYGDGGDYLRLRINGVLEGSNASQTFVMDPLWGLLGTAWLMGGFPFWPDTTYTNIAKASVGTLPSAQGYTFTTTTATAEASVFAAANNMWQQIKAGMAAGGDGNYVRAAAGFVNATGSGSVFKSQIENNTNTINESGVYYKHADGTKTISYLPQEYYATATSITSNKYPQNDNKTNPFTLIQTLKGSDALFFRNGKLDVDAWSFAATASALNQTEFGDGTTTANENADAAHFYAAQYNAGMIVPNYSSCKIQEFGYFQQDASQLATYIYNAGIPISLQAYCGIANDWVSVVNKTMTLYGITVDQAFPLAFATVPELECFMMGDAFDANYNLTALDGSVAAQVFTYPSIDGVRFGQKGNSVEDAFQYTTAASVYFRIGSQLNRCVGFGLHKATVQGQAGAVTTVIKSVERSLKIKASPLAIEI